MENLVDYIYKPRNNQEPFLDCSPENSDCAVPDLQRIWQKVTGHLRTELGEEVFMSWFPRVTLEHCKSGVVSLSVPTRFLRSWITSNYMALLQQFWKEETGKDLRIEVFVRAPGKMAVPDEGDAKTATIQSVKNDNVPIANSNEPARISVKETSSDSIGAPLDPRYTFDSFAVGAENHMAYRAAKSIAAGTHADEGNFFGVLYVQAPVGFGKTHLLQAISAETRENRTRQVLYLTAERFMYRFVGALRANEALAFKNRLRNIGLLLIDDLQFLQGKSTQQEFCHTLNELIEARHQVVVASDRPPAELESFDPRIRSRLSSGLIVTIEPFSYELRLQILQRKRELAMQHAPDLCVSDKILAFLAEQIQGNGRDLEGAFNRILAHHQFNRTDMTLTAVKNIVQDLIRGIEPNKIKIDQIQRVVSKHFEISRQDIVSSKRNRAVVRPRQICMYLAKMMTDRSLPEIGRRFGGRDHTTVLHAIRKIESLIQSDQVFSDEVSMLRHTIEN